MKEIKYNRVGDYEIPSLKQESPLPNLSRFGREYLRILKEKHPFTNIDYAVVRKERTPEYKISVNLSDNQTEYF